MVGLAAVTGVLTACGGGGGGSSSAAPVQTVLMSTYEISVTNLTNAQPLSPPVVILHDGGYRVFSVGQPASAGLEVLAEGGDGQPLIDEALAADAVTDAVAFDGPIPPGGQAQVSVTISDNARADLRVSVATMLVNTNDAFTALNGLPEVGVLAPGEVLEATTPAYDAGTEADDEAPGSIPGPADGGEGFNAVRDDDADRVSMHSGVLTAMDALPTSVLTEQHRFDNPVARIRIRRVN